MQTYIHKSKNRIRIRSDYILQNSPSVQALMTKLQKIEGIKQITHKEYAGSVAITYCHENISQETLLETLSSNGWTQQSDDNQFIENAVRKGSKTLVKGAIMMIAKKTLGVGLLGALARI